MYKFIIIILLTLSASVLANKVTTLKKQTHQDMLAPEIKTVWGEIYMGLGWQVYKSEGVNIARHPGSIRGYKSLIITYPENKDALILLINTNTNPIKLLLTCTS
ncbi:serine hydrolase [Colwellia sp. C1TZA3]|uniref:serine hydrolase n=1 Tax=Colwellia sp. C1TZA3 TaxID=2508879 RepID=UPI0011B99D95|nr:serine hydrolase [Colwellia sp. C1TZA3]TWX71371.1 serine hydrolase [Colwellia sp. C1TZA3]